MKNHNFKMPVNLLNKKSKRVGRGIGSGCGAKSGRGQKGQKSRSGGKIPYLGFEGGQTPLYRRIPKAKSCGFSKKLKIHTINLRSLLNFTASCVDMESLKSCGLISKNARVVKLLGDGELSSALTVKLHSISKTARKKVEEQGGVFQCVGV